MNDHSAQGNGEAPLVSVIIACFNARDTIERSIASALSQCSGNVEALVVDDCSTDGTRQVLEHLATSDARIQVLSTPTNSGPGVARNVALDAARGEWIAILDADDRFVDGRLDRLITLAEASRKRILFDGVVATDPVTGTRWKEMFRGVAEGELDIRFFLKQSSPHSRWQIGLMKPVIARSLIGDSRYSSELRYGEDMVFAASILLKESGHYHREIGYEYSMAEGRGQIDQHSSTVRSVDALTKAYHILAHFIEEHYPHRKVELGMARVNLRFLSKLGAFHEAKAAFRRRSYALACLLILRNPYALRVAFRRFL